MKHEAIDTIEDELMKQYDNQTSNSFSLQFDL